MNTKTPQPIHDHNNLSPKLSAGSFIVDPLWLQSVGMVTFQRLAEETIGSFAALGALWTIRCLLASKEDGCLTQEQIEIQIWGRRLDEKVVGQVLDLAVRAGVLVRSGEGYVDPLVQQDKDRKLKKQQIYRDNRLGKRLVDSVDSSAISIDNNCSTIDNKSIEYEYEYESEYDLEPEDLKVKKGVGKGGGAPYPRGSASKVLLTDPEAAKLCHVLGEECALFLAQQAHSWAESSPQKFSKRKNHYQMLLSWDRRERGAGKVFFKHPQNDWGYYPQYVWDALVKSGKQPNLPKKTAYVEGTHDTAATARKPDLKRSTGVRGVPSTVANGVELIDDLGANGARKNVAHAQHLDGSSGGSAPSQVEGTHAQGGFVPGRRDGGATNQAPDGKPHEVNVGTGHRQLSDAIFDPRSIPGWTPPGHRGPESAGLVPSDDRALRRGGDRQPLNDHADPATRAGVGCVEPRASVGDQAKAVGESNHLRSSRGEARRAAGIEPQARRDEQRAGT